MLQLFLFILRVHLDHPDHQDNLDRKENKWVHIADTHTHTLTYITHDTHHTMLEPFATFLNLSLNSHRETLDQSVLPDQKERG